MAVEGVDMAIGVGTYVRALVYDFLHDADLEHVGVVTEVTEHPSGRLVEIRTTAGTSVQALAARVTDIRVRTAAGMDVWMDAVEASVTSGTS